ncbi:MAG: hypothetical protein AAGJ35_01935 [Myxococcota bacterium]
MLLSLIYVLFSLFLGFSLSAIVSWWLGALACSICLILASPIERILDLPLRAGRWPLAGFIPLVWVGAVTLTAIPSNTPQDSDSSTSAARNLPQVRANARVDRTSMRVEKDLLHYNITIEYPKNTKLKLPSFTTHPTFNGAFLMPAEHPPKHKVTPLDSQNIRQTWNITLMAVATGPLDTPKFMLKVKAPGQKQWETIEIPSIAIEVSELGKPSQLLTSLRPAKTVLMPESPETQRFWTFLGASGMALLSLFGLAFWSLRRRVMAQQELSPQAWFEQSWSALQAKELLSKSQEKAHFFALSEVFRGYLERRFDVPALESTTEEIVLWAKHSEDLPQDTYRDIRRLLQWMDRIKFGGLQSTRDEREDADRRIHSVVRATTQVETQVERPSVSDTEA